MTAGVLLLTDRHQAAPRPLVEVVAAAVEGGARSVVLREKDLSRPERARVAAELRAVLTAAGGVLLVASDTTIVADGVHLAADEPFPEQPDRPRLVGRSCHDADEVDRAEAEGCDYVTLSPIFPSPSKPGYGPALGPTALAAVTRPNGVPVYALGGIGVDEAVELGAAGLDHVAVMGAVMRADDPAETMRRILQGIGATP